MGPTILPAQPDPRYPFVDDRGALPSAYVIGVIDPAREHELIYRAASMFKPGQHARADGLEEFKLHRSTSLLLNNDRSHPDPTTANHVTDPDFDNVAPAQPAVDRQVEHRAVAEPVLMIEPEPNCPHLVWLECAPGTYHTARVRRTAVFCRRIVFRMSHRLVPPLPATTGRGGNEALRDSKPEAGGSPIPNRRLSDAKGKYPILHCRP